MKLVLASKNKKKLAEMNDILSHLRVEVCSEAEAGVDVEVEETGTTFEENSLLKARAVMEALSPRIVIPMHYRMGQVGLPAVGEVEDFLSLVDDYVYYPGDTISINRGTRPQIAVLSFQG